MKVLAVSDNHGDGYHMEEILSIYQGDVDVWIHCGDSEFKEDHPLWQNFHTVKGNMDITDAFKDIRIINHYDQSFLIAHGHLHNVKTSFDALKKAADHYNVKIVFYGHTHVPRVDKVEDVYFINPGSITQPRGFIGKGTYSILELEGQSGKIEYYDEDHNKLPEISQPIEL